MQCPRGRQQATRPAMRVGGGLKPQLRRWLGDAQVQDLLGPAGPSTLFQLSWRLASASNCPGWPWRPGEADEVCVCVGGYRRRGHSPPTLAGCASSQDLSAESLGAALPGRRGSTRTRRRPCVRAAPSNRDAPRRPDPAICPARAQGAPLRAAARSGRRRRRRHDPGDGVTTHAGDGVTPAATVS